MDKLLAKDVSKGKIQDIEAKEARDRITVLDYDTQGIKGFRDADLVIEVIASVLEHV
jgi:3-hydroxybutyryl-CoA dehydrogenase